MNLFENILNKAKVNFANPDPTQNLQFKALQGASNLYTGVAEEASMGGQREFERKKQIAKEFLAKKGYSPELIESTLSQIERQPSFMGRVTEGLGNRMQELAKTTETLSKEQNLTKRLLVGTLAYGGDVVATAMEPIASAVSPYVQAGIEKVGLAPTVQNLGQQFQGFKERNPLTGEAIEGAFNIGQLAPMPLAKPLGNLAKQGGKAIVRGAEKVAPRVVQGVKTGVKATGEGVGKVTKSIVSQQSGLGTPAIESILKRPELQGKIRSGELSGAKTLEEARSSIDALREGYRETGKMYDTVRKSNVKVPTSEAKQVLVSQLELDGLASGGKLNLVDLPVKDRGAITQALKYIDEYKGEMTPQGALSIRQKLDDLINYNSEVGSNGQRIVTGLRAKYDEFLGNKLPGLKEIDAKYAPERQFWESIRKDIYKADGTLKDNALSVVSNITNKGNEARLARMESILPGIGEKVKALKAFEDIQNASGIKVGTYGRAATTGAIALASVPLAIASWVATHPVVVARVLEGIGLASQKIKLILAKGKNITKEDATIIQQAVAKTPKSKVENIINNLSYDPKTSKLTSKTLTKNGNTSIRPVAISNKGNVGKVEQKTIVTPKKPTPNTIKNESKVTEPVVVPKKTVNNPIVKKIASNNQKNGTTNTTDRGNTTISDKPTSVQNIGNTKEIDISSVLKEYNEKSKYFRDSGATVKALKLEGNIDDIVRNGNKLKEGWSYVEQKKLGKTEKTQGWYVQEPLNPIGGGKTITAIRADGVGIRVKLPDGYKNIEGTVARDFVENVIDRNPFIDTEIKGVVTKQLTPQSNAKQQGIIPKSIVKNPESSQTQANGPRILGKMGKVETKTSPQSATSYEAGMRRPFTLGSNKPIVKRVQEKPTNPLVEEARKYKSAEEFIKAQGEPVYHGTYAYKTSDIKKTKSIIESIYKKNGGEYTQTDINKITNDAKYILENRSKLKVKDEFLLKNLEDELSSKIKKPTVDFAGKSGKDVTDNSLGIYATPDIDFAKRFTYDVDINPYSGKKTIVQPRQGYVIDMYYKGNTLDLTKGTSKHIDLLSGITGKDKGFISDKLKTKEGTKTIQKLLSSKREILKEKGFNAVKNYAWDDTVKKYKEELAILDDNSIKTKDELTDIYNQSKPIVKNPLVEEAMRKKLLKK